MKEGGSFPVIDGHVNVGDAAEVIARWKAQGAVVRNGDAFALVGWSDVAQALNESQGKQLRVVKSFPIRPSDVRIGEIAHIDIGLLRDLELGRFVEAQLYTCPCGYRGPRPRACPKGDDCKQAPV